MSYIENNVETIVYSASLLLYILAVCIFLHPFFGYRKKKIRERETVFRVLSMIMLFFSMMLALAYTSEEYNSFWRKAYQSIIQFVMNTDFNSVIDAIPNTYGKILAGLIMFTAPVVTVTTILFAFESFRNNYIIHRYRCYNFRKTIYVFSELNEKSLSIARSIINDDCRSRKNARFVFTDVFEQNNECSFELISELNDLGIAYTKKDIVTLKWNKHFVNKKYKLFLIGENEAENLKQLCVLIDEYNNDDYKDKIELYLFSRSSTSELTINEKLKNCNTLTVKRIDYKRSLVYDYLYNHGRELIELATEDKEKNIGSFRIVLLGMGEYGLEMLKALLWFCKHTGYTSSISVYDKNPDAEREFRNACPGFYDEKTINMLGSVNTPSFNNGMSSVVDFKSIDCIEAICNENSNADFIFVSAGTDDDNIAISRLVREAYTRKKTFSEGKINETEPMIVTVVKNDEIHNSLMNGSSADNSYKITVIGNLGKIYSKDLLQINSELEKMAMVTHSCGFVKEKFYKEYYYRSSVSQVIYHNCWSVKEKNKVKNVYDNASMDNYNKDYQFTDSEKERLAELYGNELYRNVQINEKNRWNYYMLSEGFRYLQPEFAVFKERFKDYYHYHTLIKAYNDAENESEWEYTYKALFGIKNYAELSENQ